MGPGGLRRLQICSGVVKTVLGGFDSYTSPPIKSITYRLCFFASKFLKRTMYTFKYLFIIDPIICLWKLLTSSNSKPS